MEIKARQIEPFLSKPDPSVRAVLIYGNDRGMVRERVKKLIKTVIGSTDDPFLLVDLQADDLKSDPARLADEAAQIPLTGGRRAIHVRQSGNGHTKLFEPFLDDPLGDALVIVEAGQLQKSGSLRKLFEKNASAAAIACYEDDSRSLEDLIREIIRQNRLEIDPDALHVLTGSLGGDRMLSRNEVEKLCLYKGQEGRITVEDVENCIGDTSILNMDDIAKAVASGDSRLTEKLLTRTFLEGTNAIQILRGVSRYFLRLDLLRGQIDRGGDLEAVVKSVRPPIFFRDVPVVRGHVRRWTGANLRRALDLLLEAEQNCKTTGMPIETLCSRALLGISFLASPGR